MGERILSFLDRWDGFTKRHLPHLDRPGAAVFVTFRLAGSLPRNVLASLAEQSLQWEKELEGYPDAKILLHKRVIARLDKYLDESIVNQAGPLYLQEPALARILLKHMQWGAANRRYLLHRYCVMPNHAHMVLETLPREWRFAQYDVSWAGCIARREEADRARFDDRQECLSYWKLGEVMKGLKGVSAREINKAMGKTGTFWQDESFDHVIRDQLEYDRILTYIDDNPVAAGLTTNAADWPFSSKNNPIPSISCKIQ